MAVPTDEQLVKRLHELMSEGDLATATIRSLITSLEDDYGISLEERKALLRQEVWRFPRCEALPESLSLHAHVADTDVWH